jgi:hypothetical protein
VAFAINYRAFQRRLDEVLALGRTHFARASYGDDAAEPLRAGPVLDAGAGICVGVHQRKGIAYDCEIAGDG